jgi:hypothetical protein
MDFWTTLPGILTGIAAVITASAGLYLAFVHTNNSNNNVPPSSISSVNSTQESSNPKPESSSNNCLEQEFAEVQPIEAGSGEQTLKSSAGVIRIKLTDNHQPVGALCLKFYPNGNYFEIEQVIDSKGKAVKDLYNETRSEYVENKLPNDDSLDIQFGGQKYSLRLMSHGGKSTAKFNKL